MNTEHKRMELELRQSEEKYRSMFENAVEGMFQTTQEGQFLSVNPSYAEMFGYSSPEELITGAIDVGTHIYANLDDRTRFKELMDELGMVQRFEFLALKKDGTRIWVSLNARAVKDAHGTVLYYEGTTEDITLLKRAEKALKESESRLQDIFDTSQAGIILVDHHGIITFANKRMSEMFRHPLPELIGSSYPSHLHPYESVAGLTLMQKLIAGEIDSVSTFERHYICFDGSDFWGYLSGRRLTDAKGNFISLVGIIVDITERKMAEEKLKQQADAMEASADGIAVINKDHNYVYVNKAHARIYGYDTVEELTGKSWRVLYDENELQRFDDDIMPEFSRKGQWWGEATGKKKNGSTFPQEVSLTTLDNGGLVCVVRDITERKMMEDALKESEEKYRNIFENALEGIFQSTPEGRILSVNPALANICGFDSPQEIIDAFTDIGTQLYVHPEDRISLKELFRRQGFAEHFETQFYKKDGSKVWVSMNIHAVKDAEGNIVFYEGILEDITARKQVEGDLRTAHQRLFDIIEFLPDATFVIDDEKKAVAWNLACEELTGIRKEEIIGKGDYAYAIPFYGERRPTLIDYVTMDSNELQHRYKSIKKKGHLLYAEAFTPMLNNGKGVLLSGKASPLYDRTGKVVGAIESVRDITEFKQLESQLHQSQKMESIGTLAGGIAHDFNNILTALMGYTTLIQMKMDKNSPLRPYVDQILSASQKAADLTQSLLTFSRQKPVTLAPLDMNDTIKATKKLLKRLLTEDIELRTSLTKDNTVVMADKSQMDQILFNLVTNARDAMPKGGMVSIETGIVYMDGGFTRVHGFGEQGKYVLINISDTGTGMDEATREKIFEPFFTTKEIGKGTGLGLATVYGIIKQHGGYITVYSKLGHGTNFRIYLPAVSINAGQKKHETVPVNRGDETILIAEDNEEARRFMREALQEYGYRTIEAVDGENAIEKFKQHKDTNLIIIDSVMPKKNGREVYEEIHGMSPHTKVLFTSGYTRDFVLNKGVEDGKFDFIAKPLSIDKLLRKVREVLDR